MRCSRCGGMMVCETFYGDCTHFGGWKCISCGEIVDRVIMENRRSSAALRPRVQQGAPSARKRMVIIF